MEDAGNETDKAACVKIPDSGKPIMIELFAGLHGWGEAALVEGFEVIGYDIEDMCAALGHPRPEGITLIIQDVLTLHGSQFKDAAVIVASPPCQAYSYRAMPWSRAKALPPPDNTLFEACFRIQREASEAAGHHIPMVVENVRGAQRWVGKAAWHHGSFYLWGDVPALMPIIPKRTSLKRGITHRGDGSTNFHKVPGFRFDGSGKTFQTASVEHAGQKVVDIPAHPREDFGWNHSEELQASRRTIRCTCPTECDCENPEPENDESVAHCSEECPVHNLRPRPSLTCPMHGESGTLVASFDKTGRMTGLKTEGHVNIRDGHSHTRHLTNPSESEGLKVPGISLSAGKSVGFNVTVAQRYREGVKQSGISGVRENGKGDSWFQDGAARPVSRSNSRKAASAMIAKIPYPLAQWIARTFYPRKS